MNGYEYAKRVKRLTISECNLELREEKVAKASIKYYEKFAKLQARIQRKKLKLETDRAATRKMEESNLKLQNFLETETEEVQQLKEQITKLKNDAEQNNTSQTDVRKNMLEQMDKLRCLKRLTGILLKKPTLKNWIEGVCLCEKSSTTHWVPFRIDLSKQPLHKIQNLFLQRLTTDIACSTTINHEQMDQPKNELQ